MCPKVNSEIILFGYSNVLFKDEGEIRVIIYDKGCSQRFIKNLNSLHEKVLVTYSE